MKITKQLLQSALVAGLIYGCLASASWSAVKPLSTRVIANATAKETPVEIINESKNTYMVQSWLEDLNGSDKNIPLVLTPPVVKLLGGQQGKLRLVVMPGQIPQDRESAFWLNIQEIPPKVKSENRNILTVAVRTRIKVFVRPESLANKVDELENAVEQLVWSHEREGRNVWLKVNNPTPFHISFGQLTIRQSGSQKETDIADRFNMSLPKASRRYAIPSSFIGKKVTITYRSINDYGGVSKAVTKELQL